MTTDVLLTTLAEARRRRDTADEYIRTLLAYARELTTPRPYRLADLAEAAGMSISGVRSAYTQADVNRAATSARPPGTPAFHECWLAIAAEREAISRAESD